VSISKAARGQLVLTGACAQVDIEGFEYEVLSGFQWANSCGFPRQISMEIHWNVGIKLDIAPARELSATVLSLPAAVLVRVHTFPQRSEFLGTHALAHAW
jgi:hypothetical protein